ncbi:MAG: 16S rRNA (guanine(527)-N(7))-methyltransferase RsmG [Pseudomonadota bacterium]
MPEADAKARIGARVSRETFQELEAYAALLVRWQARINLIGPATVGQIWERHIADSLQIVTHLEEALAGRNAVIADMGAGAGLPSIPLALYLRANQRVFVHLIDSNIKKAAFLREALRALGLEGCVHHARLEHLRDAGLDPPPQIICARALAPLASLSEFASPWILQGATGLFLKGRNVDKELADTADDRGLQYKAITLDGGSGSSLVIVEKKGIGG